MARVELKVTVVGIYRYEARSFSGYGCEMHYIYKMTDDDKIYVWKTTSNLCYKYEDPNGCEVDAKGRVWACQQINKDSVIRIAATIKGESKYNGETQTEVNRVKVLEVISAGKTAEEIATEREAAREAKRAAQIASLTKGDRIWVMPYKQYKEHYSDCETVIDSYENVNGKKVISVIIRDGRLKPSGVRGCTFKGYEIEFTAASGKRGFCSFRAVCEENAFKQLLKEFPGATDLETRRIYF